MSDVKWYGQHVKGIVEGARKNAVKKIALDIEARTKLHITSNQQIDTGFMRMSVYTLLRDGEFRNVRSSMRTNREGRKVKRETAEPPAIGDSDAIVGVGAIYAVYQELRRSFLRVAFEQGVAAAGGIVQSEFRFKGF
jgi:hypothetical protein